MTDITEKYTKTEQAERVIKTVCDWCGEEIPSNSPAQRYYQQPVEVITKYSSYDGDSIVEGWGVDDLCAPCGAKLRELLAARGIKITVIAR